MQLQIQTLQNVNNPNSIHGIYPYRGKISAVDAQMIVKQFPRNHTLLDPFCGTGTIVYEGLKSGLTTYGLDFNPIAFTVANGKINIPYDKEQTLWDLKNLFEQSKALPTIDIMPSEAKKHFHTKTADEIMRVLQFTEEMNDYVKSCFYGAICLTARGCNGYVWTSSSVGKDIVPKVYINFYEKLLQKVKKHYYPIRYGEGQIYFGDARKLSSFFKPEMFDIVFTSPPYFNCLDYTSYYTKIIYNILRYDRLEIKDNLIQNIKTYRSDMKKVLEELYVITKKGAKIIFVVGDKKIHNKIINGAEFFDEISPFKSVEIKERTYEKTSSKVFDAINKTNRKEQIIIWEK